MKKLLAILLAALMLAGVFAVGASASPFQPFAAQEQASPFPFAVAANNLENDLSEVTVRVTLEIFEANLNAHLAYEGLYRVFDEFPAAFINGRAGMNAFYAAAISAITPLEPQLEAATRAWRNFTDSSDAAVAAGIADGTAERLYRAYLQAEFAIKRAVSTAMEAHVLPQALAFVREYARWRLITQFVPDGTDWDAFRNALDRLIFDLLNVNNSNAVEAAYLAMFAAGDWAGLYAFYAAFAAGTAALIEEFGGTVYAWLLPAPPPEPSEPPWHETLPAFVQFIFRWLLFGWIWM